MPETITIHPTGIYNTDALCAMLDVSPQSLADARRTGALCATRKGRRTIYLGEWVLAWLRAAATPGAGAQISPKRGDAGAI